jgi:hypothetical protein
VALLLELIRQGRAQPILEEEPEKREGEALLKGEAAAAGPSPNDDGDRQGKRPRTTSPASAPPSPADKLSSAGVARVVERVAKELPGSLGQAISRMAGGRLDEIITAQFQRLCPTAPPDNGESDDEGHD